MCVNYVIRTLISHDCTNITRTFNKTLKYFNVNILRLLIRYHYYCFVSLIKNYNVLML